MSRLLPGLADPLGSEILGALQNLDPPEISGRVRLTHADQVFPPTGGTPISEADLGYLRDSITGLAASHGFPTKRPGVTAPFDRDCAEALHASLDITPHTASSREAWTFLTCCVLPDVAAWRFPALAPERFLGDVNRNVFRRLWWRAEILGPPPELPDPVWGREDVLVNVMERPGLSGNPTIAKAICDVFRCGVGGRKESDYEPLMRDLMRRVMRRSAFVSLALLPAPQLRNLLEGLMGDTVAVADGGEPAQIRMAGA